MAIFRGQPVPARMGNGDKGAGIGAAAAGGWALGTAIYEANAEAIQDFLAGG